MFVALKYEFSGSSMKMKMTTVYLISFEYM